VVRNTSAIFKLHLIKCSKIPKYFSDKSFIISYYVNRVVKVYRPITTLYPGRKTKTIVNLADFSKFSQRKLGRFGMATHHTLLNSILWGVEIHADSVKCKSYKYNFYQGCILFRIPISHARG